MHDEICTYGESFSEATPESSNIRSVAWDAATLILTVEFKSGTYDYAGVPDVIAYGLKDAPSRGKYFAENVKHCYLSTKRPVHELEEDLTRRLEDSIRFTGKS